MTYENSGSKNEIAGLLKLTGVLVFGMWNDKYKQPRFIENAAQEEVDNQTALLNAAMANLVAKPTEPENPADKSKLESSLEKAEA